jgi:hypothetical protein
MKKPKITLKEVILIIIIASLVIAKVWYYYSIENANKKPLMYDRNDALGR